MHGSHRTAVAAAALLALCAVASVAVVPAGRVLVAEDVETGERYVTSPVSDGVVVALNYTHSVEKTPVSDQYTVRGDRLENTRMTFESYGWGLPSGANVTRRDGQFVYDPPGSYEAVTVSPGPTAGHTLRVGARSYDLVARTDARPVRLHVTRPSTLTAVTHDS